MNKKIITSVIATLIIMGSTSFQAFAAMSNGTVAIGNKAFDLGYANDSANSKEIINAIVEGGGVYVKDFNGNWIDNITGQTIGANVIPAVVYKNAEEQINFASGDKDAATTSTVASVSTITDTKNIGDTYTLPTSVTVTLADNSTKKLAVTWDKLPDTKVVGEFTFTGTLIMVDGILNPNNITIVAKLNVVDNVVKVKTVILNKTTDILTVGDTDTLISEVSPSDATNKSVTWTSSNLNVATVTNGVVTAVSSGTAIITATTVDGSKTANCTITVNNKKGYVYNRELEIDLKVRSAPNLNGAVLGYLYNYEKIEILDTIFDNNNNNKWDKIIYNNGFAYVNDAYIQAYNSPADNVSNIALNITKKFEGGPSNEIAGNFDGQGLSLGYLQWCIGQGTLQPLLNRMDREYNSEMKAIFGANYNSIHNMILDTAENQLKWAKNINDSANKISEPWYSQFVSLCDNVYFKNIENDAEVYTVSQATRICDKYNFKTVRGFALAFDIAVQNGSISSDATKIIDVALEQIPSMSEKTLLGVIANAVADSSDNNSEDIRSRKMTIVNGQGIVHGSMLYLDTNYQLSDTYWR